MEITLPISSIVVIAIGSVGVAVSLFVGILLLTQKNKKHLSVSLLAFLLLLSGLTLLNDLLVTSGISNRIPQLYFIPLYYSLSIPPLFFLFIKSKYKHRLERTAIVHLLLPGIQALVYFSIGFRSVAFKSALYQQEAFRIFLSIETLLFPLLLVVYSLLSLSYLRRHRQESLFWQDDIRRWLKRFTGGMLGIALLEIGFSLLEYGTSRDFLSSLALFPVHTLILSAFVFWIAINGFKQYYPLQIFTSSPAQETLLIDDQELKRLVAKLKLLMKQDKVYLNPDLNVELLARYLGISEKRCSYVLNKGMEANFNQYINSLRIEAFKERVRQGQNKTYTLASMAYACGFDSKSTFNRVFKAACGITPSQFVKDVQELTKKS